MPNTRLTLARLELLLLAACDDLRGNMDAREYEDPRIGKVCVPLPEPEVPA